jgi:hypothetical protein
LWCIASCKDGNEGGALETWEVMRDDDALAVAEIVNVFPDLDDLTGNLVTGVDAAELARLRLAIPFHSIAAADAALERVYV